MTPRPARPPHPPLLPRSIPIPSKSKTRPASDHHRVAHVPAKPSVVIMTRDGGASGEMDLWAMAAELERQFAGYKQRLAESSGTPPDDDDARGGGNSDGEEDGGDGDGGGEVRGRLYEAYARRRDERLREGWRARMERKEAEVKALWAQLERGAGAGGRAACCGGATTTDDGGGTAGEGRRSSDVAAPASRISGKKHARTRSFSSSATKSSRPDAGTTRRALSHEPPPSTSSEPPAAAADGGGAGSRKDSRRVARVITGGGATTAPKRRVFSAHRTSAAKELGSAKGGTKPKPPRSLPRRTSSGGLEDLKEAAAAPVGWRITCAIAAPVTSCSSEQATVHSETGKASLPTPFAGAATNARSTSPDSDGSEVAGNDHEGEANSVGEHNAEEATMSPGRLVNEEITSDSDTEPSYVFVKKDVVDEDDAMTRRSNAKPELKAEKKNGDAAAEETTAPLSDAIVAESATTMAEEAPARESSDESSSFSCRSGGSPPSSAPASYISQAPSIERLLEEDAALLRKKRQESAEKFALTTTLTTPPARISGAARSPREAAVRGFKRFLSFRKKNRGGREVTVIDCTPPSVADDDSGSGGWQSTNTIKPRMASLDAASDDMDHGYAVSPRACSLQSLVAASPAKSELHEIDPQDKSPKAHRPFFSFLSFNCGRS